MVTDHTAVYNMHMGFTTEDFMTLVWMGIRCHKTNRRKWKNGPSKTLHRKKNYAKRKPS